MSNGQKTQNTNDQDQPIDLAKKLADAQKEAQEKDQASSQYVQQDAEEQIKTLRAELEQMTEIAKRTMADLQNLKRRHEEERRLIINMANVDFIRTLIPIVDNLDRAKLHLPEGVSTEWFQGIEICANQLHKLLEDAGVKPIDSLNQPFNPDLHEALAQGPGPKDTVIEELEKGYLLGDRVIRHAKVKVGS